MNLLRATASDGHVRTGDLVLPMPEIARGDVIMGLRPEALRPAAEGVPSMEFEVDVVEPLGDEVGQ